MKNVNIKKGSIILLKGMILVLLVAIILNLGFKVNIEDALFVEGLVVSFIGMFSIMGQGRSDLWTSIDHNGMIGANEEVLIMEKESKALVESFVIDINSIMTIAVGMIGVGVSYFI